tara:strand:+ start:1213 stop:2391 length:1179 start_codon:yes stop_codon:yes gene_type:complete
LTKKNLPYGNHFISDSDIKSVIEVLKTDWLTTGPYVENFEKVLGEVFGAKYVSAVSSGTAALHLAALSLGWGKDDIILTSPITFVASSNSILYAGATPDFVDIDLKSYTIDLNQLEKKIIYYKKKQKKIKAVIGVDYAGHPCHWRELRGLADKYDFQLVNDNCHAMKSEYDQDPTYAVKYADIVVQSFHPVKHITTGEGGAVITNNKKYDKKVKEFRTHGISYDIKKDGKYIGPWYREMVSLGYNYRLTDIQSALGISQLKNLDKRINRRRELASIYDNLFSMNKIYIVPQVSPTVKHSYHLYPLQIRFKELKIDKNKLFKTMLDKRIQLQVHYVPIHFNEYYQKNFGFKIGDFPNAEKFYDREISIPIYPELKDLELIYVVDTLNDVINKI